MPSVRRLTAILAADVAGYSRLMGVDEERTHESLKAHRRAFLDPKITEHHGRIFKTTGDGMLVEFPSVVDAVRCAVEVQRGMVERNLDTPPEQRIEFRVGINLGDVIVEGDDIFGDGVNVAARLEALAEPGGICISRVVRDQVRDRLDYTFEDLGEQQVKNIARPVRVYRVRDNPLPVEPPSPASPQPIPLPDKPSIAVLPFVNLSGDPEQEYFADGMVDEIITALSRIKWLFVIAYYSSFTYKGQAIDVKQIGRELGVRYVLEGSVRRSGQRVRITAQLIDAITGAHLWADRFDGSLEAIFDLQDQVALSIAGVIEPTLQAAEMRYSAERPTSDLTAYDLFLRARSIASTYERSHLAEALELLEQAITREPRYGPALALAATYRVDLENFDWSDDREERRTARWPSIWPGGLFAPPPTTPGFSVVPPWCSGALAKTSMPLWPWSIARSRSIRALPMAGIGVVGCVCSPVRQTWRYGISRPRCVLIRAVKGLPSGGDRHGSFRHASV